MGQGDCGGQHQANVGDPSRYSITSRSANGGNHRALGQSTDVRFSNRPSGVKRFSGYRPTDVDVAHGLSLLFGLGTKALPSWDSKTRWNNLSGDLAVNVTAGSSGHTNSPHPSSREGHHSTVGWISGFSYLI